ncbi:MAG: hypothetical protein M3011_09435 [Actinomycetota bacterium]|nr:hypothetical protein [Actinomycetota bacterium]
MSTAPHDSPADGTNDATAGSVPRRKCSRCQALFEGDPTLDNGGGAEWWLCPPCRSSLLARTSPVS